MAKKKRNIIDIFALFGSIILLLLILFHILEFFFLLPKEINFILKLVSITLFGYLFYKTSVSHLLFGSKCKEIDMFILIGYFSFSIKNIIGLIINELSELPIKSLFYDFYSFISTNGIIIEYYGFIFGSIIILLSSAYFCFVKIGKNSLMDLIQESKKLKGRDIFIRFIVSFIVLLAFYIIVFNLAIEWLVLVIYGPLLVILFFIYLLIALHRKRFKANKFLYNVGFSIEWAYEKLLKMFHSKNILLGISGLLVLHLLTDFFVFIIPYLTGHFAPNYLSLVHAKPHIPIITLFLKDLGLVSGWNLGGMIFVYLFNLIAISVILLIPFYMWLKIFKKRKIKYPKWCLALSYSSLFTFIAMPLFSINKLRKDYAGVDILTQGISNIDLLNIIFIIGAIILIAFYLLGRNKTFYQISNIGLIFFSLIFVFIYLYNFFISISLYYLEAITSQFPDIFVKIILFLFFVINILFYVVGYGMLLKYILVDNIYKRKC